MKMRAGSYGVLGALLGIFLCGAAGLIVLNQRFASQTADALTTAHALGGQRLEIRVVATDVQLLKNDLAARRYLGRTLEALKTSSATLEQSLASLEGQTRKTQSRLYPLEFAPFGTIEAQRNLKELRQLWNEYRTTLKPILKFEGDPYIETADSGAQLSPVGEQLNRLLDDAQRTGSARQEQISKLTRDLAMGIDAGARGQLATVRSWSFGALAISALLLLVAVVFMVHAKRQAQALTRAKRETDDILRTVNQGLFLLDEELNLGSERSEALEQIFRRKDFDNLSFASLLRGLVPEKTLDTAVEYVKLLWGDRVNEKLIKTINPLSEVEVHFDSASGKSDTHYLEFDFNRVRTDGAFSRILVTVNDVTRRVQLGHELHDSQEKAQAQLDMLLHILHVEPRSLSAFLDESEVSMKMVNSILREPVREEMAFRAKLDRLFRQVHGVKGEAGALGLKTVEQRAHSFEEALSELRGRPALSGNDFLPLVVKLDDLFGHLSQVREMVGRLSDLRVAMSGDAKAAVHPHASTESESDTGPSGTLIQPAPAFLERMLGGTDPTGLQHTLSSLAERIAGEHGKKVSLNCLGLDQVPEQYRRPVKDIAIQMMRNSLTHGIESPEERAAAYKSAIGAVTLRFDNRGAEGVELVFQDDGRGLSAQVLRDTAVDRGLITKEQAAKLDDRRALSLIFMPGFSTQAEVTTDAGRGVGMDLVRTLVQELGGKCGVSTAVGKFVRFRIWLPATAEARAA